MATINMGGVIKGGLAAGLVMNISETILNVPVAGARMEAELAARNLPPIETSAIIIFVVLCFLFGIGTVWLYAAIRPRFGPGPKTAMCAGSLVWALSYGSSAVSMGVMGFFSLGLIALTLVWTLVEMLVAAYVGAYLYSE